MMVLGWPGLGQIDGRPDLRRFEGADINSRAVSADEVAMRKDSHICRISMVLMNGLTAVGAWLIMGLPDTARAGSGELALAPQVMTELNQILKASETLHKSLLSQDDEQIELGVRDIIVQLERAKVVSARAKPHERRHLLRILDAALEQFELTRTAYGEQRRLRLQEGFNQLANIVRIYRVDRAYAIFFCPKDHSTWVQRGNRPQNPFGAGPGDGRRAPCGLRVPR